MCTINVWQKVLPAQMNMAEAFSREEIEQVLHTKQSIKEFSTNLVNHVQNLLDYLQQTKRDKPFRSNYTAFAQSPIYQQFKQTMMKTRGTTLL